MTRLDTTQRLNQLARQGTRPLTSDIVQENVKQLNKTIRWQHENGSRGLRFVKLDLNSLQLMVFTDGSFANNTDLSSQIGYVCVLADKHNQANIIHWSSTKSKRVTRIVLAYDFGTDDFPASGGIF